jgi:S-formylglutathione hydrolase FrmB
MALARKLRLIGLGLTLLAAQAIADGVYSYAGPDGPAQTAYAPAKGAGPIVIVLSGASGQNAYQTFAGDVSRLGYYTVLLDGKDILTRQQDGMANLKKAIDRAQRSPQAVPGKAAVVGLSQGGGGALVHAASLSDQVSMVVAYYPAISFLPNPGVLVERFRVPVLVLAGGEDRYNNCCLIGSMRAMEAAAKQSAARFELVVYPEAQHSFNMYGPTQRRDDERDAWRRVQEMLRLHQPLPTGAAG